MKSMEGGLLHLVVSGSSDKIRKISRLPASQESCFPRFCHSCDGHNIDRIQTLPFSEITTDTPTSHVPLQRTAGDVAYDFYLHVYLQRGLDFRMWNGTDMILQSLRCWKNASLKIGVEVINQCTGLFLFGYLATYMPNQLSSRSCVLSLRLPIFPRDCLPKLLFPYQPQGLHVELSPAEFLNSVEIKLRSELWNNGRLCEDLIGIVTPFLFVGVEKQCTPPNTENKTSRGSLKFSISAKERVLDSAPRRLAALTTNSSFITFLQTLDLANYEIQSEDWTRGECDVLIQKNFLCVQIFFYVITEYANTCRIKYDPIQTTSLLLNNITRCEYAREHTLFFDKISNALPTGKSKQFVHTITFANPREIVQSDSRQKRLLSQTLDTGRIDNVRLHFRLCAKPKSLSKLRIFVGALGLNSLFCMENQWALIDRNPLQ